MTRGRKLLGQARFVAQRPDMLLRKLRGQSVIEIALDEVVPYLPERPLIVEAGAADGQDTAAFVARWPGCEVHAFEPVPAAFEQVLAATAGMPQVHRYPMALSDRVGSASMFISGHADDPDRTDSSSLLRPTGHLDEYPTVVFGQEITVTTTTLDVWRSESGVERIDLMWLDMQGGELAAVRSSPGTLAVTGAVLMEVSRRELYAGAPLYPEVVQWMATQGFRPAIDRVSATFGNMLFVRN
jgi:FkbM family methyltransferase